jgi:hypothetical protein
MIKFSLVLPLLSRFAVLFVFLFSAAKSLAVILEEKNPIKLFMSRCSALCTSKMYIVHYVKWKHRKVSCSSKSL